MEKILHYNSQVLDSEHANSIVDTIIKLCLKKGDTFNLYPFNYFEDEKTDYKDVRKEHLGYVVIEDISIIMIESWNGRIRTKINVFLKNINPEQNKD